MVSICIATYNGEEFIEEQLKSILSQINEDDEIIISDDNSIDTTIETVNKFNDVRIKIYSNDPENSGYTRNFENALLKASGDFIFLSDQDDVWYKDKYRLTLNKLIEYDFVASDAKFVNNNLEELGVTFFGVRGGYKASFIGNIIKQKYLGCCIAFNKEILNKALPFPENVKFCTHDLWLSLIATFYYKSFVINQPLLYYL